MKTISLNGLSLTAMAVAIAGCASMETNESLEQARTAVNAASNDPLVQEYAVTELNRARESLNEAARVFEDEGDSRLTEVEHDSYLATRYAETAMAIADEARAEAQIEEAEAERSRVLLEVRTAEAEAAQMVAARNEQDAELAARQAMLERERANAAESRAEDLSEQLNELKAEETERGIVLTLSDVLFDVDESTLKPGANNTIDQLAAFLQDYPDRELAIEGHTDSTGPEQYNEMLSEQRAEAVAMALTQRGVPDYRVKTYGMGESTPVATNDTSAGRQQNRRVEIIIEE